MCSHSGLFCLTWHVTWKQNSWIYFTCPSGKDARKSLERGEEDKKLGNWSGKLSSHTKPTRSDFFYCQFRRLAVARGFRRATNFKKVAKTSQEDRTTISLTEESLHCCSLFFFQRAIVYNLMVPSSSSVVLMGSLQLWLPGFVTTRVVCFKMNERNFTFEISAFRLRLSTNGKPFQV